MKEKSIFLEKQGYTPKNKVLDFLITVQDFDYSLKDIAKYSGISYPCMKQLKTDLIKNKWIVMTRKVGKAKMYKLNLKNPVVDKFIDFFWAVVESEVDKQIAAKMKKQETKIFKSSGPVAVSASASHI